MAKIIFYSTLNLEKWDYRQLDNGGIGGSETSHIEMALRLSKRGHTVISYNSLPEDCPDKNYGSVSWRDLSECNYSEDGVWIFYRCPDHLDKFPKHDKQTVWFMSQDEWYPSMTEERAKKIDKFMALCKAHAASIAARHPFLKDKIIVTSNGLRVDKILELEKAEVPVRNPHRLMWASSPDRGLKHLLKTFKKAKEFIPDLELHCFYGFNNIDKMLSLDSKGYNFYRKIKEEVEKGMDQPGVFWHGRLSQDKLYQEWMKSGIWCYQTNFTETSCITSMEAQALGAIPITHPLWALDDNIMHGILINGDAYNDRLVKSRYFGEILRMADPQLQESIRPQMMADARRRFDWERIVDQWEGWLNAI